MANAFEAQAAKLGLPSGAYFGGQAYITKLGSRRGQRRKRRLWRAGGALAAFSTGGLAGALPSFLSTQWAIAGAVGLTLGSIGVGGAIYAKSPVAGSAWGFGSAIGSGVQWASQAAYAAGKSVYESAKPLIEAYEATVEGLNTVSGMIYQSTQMNVHGSVEAGKAIGNFFRGSLTPISPIGNFGSAPPIF